MGGAPAMAQLESQTQTQGQEPWLDPDHVRSTKSLICALNLVSRNLPLPPDLYDAVSSICSSREDADAVEARNGVVAGAAAAGESGSVASKVLVWVRFVMLFGFL